MALRLDLTNDFKLRLTPGGVTSLTPLMASLNSAAAAAASASAAASSQSAAATSATNAANSATSAASSAAAAQAVGSTNDTIIASRINDTASATTTALAATIARESGKTFTPEKYGAVGNGVADDTQAVRDCFNAANALARAGLVGTIKQPGATVVLTGTYKLTTLAAPIDILCNVMETRAAFVVPDAYAGVAVRVGHTTSGSYLQNAKITLPDVMKALPTSLTAGSVGVRVQNIGNSEITFSRTCYFETGIHLTGVGQGTVYNQINIGWISYCKVSLKLVPDTGGWVNQNTFVGGGIQQSPSYDGGGLRRTGWRHLVIDGAGINAVNGNTFVGVSFEGDVSEYVFTIAHAYDNTWIGTRHEQGTAATAVTASASSPNLTSTAHGLAVGDKLFMNATSAPGGMFTGVPYYVIAVPDADTFTISQKKGGTAVTFTSAGSGVTFLRPQRILLDPTIVCYNNVVRDHMSVLGFLETINSAGTGSGNTVESPNNRTADDYNSDGRPTFRGRNRNAAETRRPIFAAYPATVNPEENPHGWTAALGNPGLLFQTAEAETGRLTCTGGALQWKRPADAAPFDIGSMVRSPALITTISGLSLAANTTTTATITLTGASVNDHVTITPAGVVPAGVTIAYARVTSANTILIAFGNLTGSSISLTLDLQAMVVRRFV